MKTIAGQQMVRVPHRPTGGYPGRIPGQNRSQQPAVQGRHEVQGATTDHPVLPGTVEEVPGPAHLSPLCEMCGGEPDCSLPALQ